MTEKRSELEIAIAIIAAIWDEERRNGAACKSRLQCQAYLNWKALNLHINKLQDKDLIQKEKLSLTDHGINFLKTYRSHLEPQLKLYGF